VTSVIEARAVGAHRFLFIAATAVLAVGTSRVADNSSDTGSWLLTVGGALVMYFADICSDIDRASEELTSSTSAPRNETRSDLFRLRAPKGTLPLMSLGWLIVLIGLIWS
jgi:hypothetical protein